MDKVVITGLGVVSALGIDVPEFYENLLEAKVINACEKDAYPSHGTEDKTSRVSAEYKKIIEDDIMVKNLPQTVKYGVYATRKALKDAKLSGEILKDKRVSVIIGNNDAEPEVFDSYIEHNKFIKKPYSSFYIAKYISDYFGFHGSAYCVHNSCASSNMAVDLALNSLKNDECDIVITGGVDAFSLKNFTGFHSLRAISKTTSKPFSKDRDGIVITEGAGIVVLEKYESAIKRGVKPYCEVLGVGISNDAHHLTQPNAEGIKLAMQRAVKNAGITFHDIDYIMAHGTGTNTNDKVESSVILDLYSKDNMPKVCSIKGTVGHMMGAAGAIGLVAISMIYKNGFIPPSPKSVPLDDDCKIEVITKIRKDTEFNIFLNHSFGFGGNNAVVVLKSLNK